MSIVERAKNILLKPVSEWEVIAKEPATAGGLITGYAAPLAIIAAISTTVGAILFGAMLAGMMGGAFASAAVGGIASIVSAVLGLIATLAIVYLMGMIVSALAPSFGGKSDSVQGTKLIVYAGTAVWVAGFFGIIPLVGGLISLVGYIYACYLIVIGIRPLMEVPQDKMAGMAVVTLLIYVVLAVIVYFIIGLVSAMFTFAGTVATLGY